MTCRKRRLFAILVAASFVFANVLGAQEIWNGQTSLPAGLSVIQLKGNLVCPPMRVPHGGILVACDDRTVKLISESGQLRWSMDTDRLIRGPLFSLTDAMALVALSGEQIAAFRMDGSLVWQQRIEGSAQSWFLGLPDGRLIQAFTDGRIRYCNPDGSTLLSYNVHKEILPVPRLVDGAVEFRLGGGAFARLQFSGELEPARLGIAPAVTASQTVSTSLSFDATKPAANSYAVHVSGPLGILDFTSRGEIGHWLLDNRDDGLVAWGDSLWRCFIYIPPAPSHPLMSVPPSTGQRYGFSGYLSNLKGSIELEWRYLQALMSTNPLTGPREVLDHVSKAIKTQRLAGRLQFYEDVLALQMENQLSQRQPDIGLMVDALGIMASFPSLRHLPRVVEILKQVDDEVAILACIGFLTRLGSDPDGLALAVIDQKMESWVDSGRLPNLLAALRAFSGACASSWPPSPASARMKASIGKRP